MKLKLLKFVGGIAYCGIIFCCLAMVGTPKIVQANNNNYNDKGIEAVVQVVRRDFENGRTESAIRGAQMLIKMAPEHPMVRLLLLEYSVVPTPPVRTVEIPEPEPDPWEPMRGPNNSQWFKLKIEDKGWIVSPDGRTTGFFVPGKILW